MKTRDLQVTQEEAAQLMHALEDAMYHAMGFAAYHGPDGDARAAVVRGLFEKVCKLSFSDRKAGGL